MFHLPEYHSPDFSLPAMRCAPDARTAPVFIDGTAPEGFHATSIFPEYFRINGEWQLAEESRMDCCVVVTDSGLKVVEPRNLKKGDLVITGRSEDCSEGIFLNSTPFHTPSGVQDTFSFRTGRSRETAHGKDYDTLADLLQYEKEHGRIIWVLGPACSFDETARKSMQALADNGFVHALLAGNALATHDLEAAYFQTALGQNIRTQESVHNGHYHHLDVINKVREAGSISAFIEKNNIQNGIMYGLVKNHIPFVLAGSIRDDGPLPEVIGNVYKAQKAMREEISKATTVIALATQLHTIATGNMTPAFRVQDGIIRPVYFYTIDISEFAGGKLRDRGSLYSVNLVTNVQDFLSRIAYKTGSL